MKRRQIMAAIAGVLLWCLGLATVVWWGLGEPFLQSLGVAAVAAAFLLALLSLLWIAIGD